MNIDLAKPMPSLPPITTEKLDQYITQLALTGKKRRAAMLALIEPHSLWAYRKTHSDLAEREAEALAFYAEWIVEEIEEAMFNRAIKGVTEPVFYEGIKCGHKRVYSDRLLALLAKRYIPEYRDHLTVDANVKAGVLVVNTPLTVQEWEKQYGTTGTAIDATVQSGTGADSGGRPDGPADDHSAGSDSGPCPDSQPEATGPVGPGGNDAG
ncbi:MAG: hypothetical protein EHM35_00790 [Planctomycetaceae bacterium]|nr:MAG: hypothetical protein EHM35_00790 [Planctomycetaceae bacterium]